MYSLGIPEYSPGIPQLLLRYSFNIPLIILRCSLSIPQIFLRYSSGIPQTFLRYCPGIPWTIYTIDLVVHLRTFRSTQGICFYSLFPFIVTLRPARSKTTWHVGTLCTTSQFPMYSFSLAQVFLRYLLAVPHWSLSLSLSISLSYFLSVSLLPLRFTLLMRPCSYFLDIPWAFLR